MTEIDDDFSEINDSNIVNPLDWQYDFITANADIMCMFAGRRSGKTDAFAMRMVRICSSFTGVQYLYVTPTSEQGTAIFNKIITHPSFECHISRYVRRPYPKIYFENDKGETESFIAFRSLQRDSNLVGDEWDEIIIDESQNDIVTQETAEAVLMPMARGRIARHRNGFERGSIILGGQFRGKDWRYEKYWLPGMPEIDGRPNKAKKNRFQSWCKSSDEGWAFGVLPGGKNELESIQADIPSRIYDQEYRCIPGANMSALFDMVYLDKCTQGAQEATTQRGHQYICGIDPGKKKDFTAVVVLRVWKEGRDWYGHVVHDEELPQVEHAIQARQAAAIAKRYNAPCVVDCTGNANGGHYENVPSETINQYEREVRAAGLRFEAYYWNSKTKNQVYENLQVAIEQTRITWPSTLTKLREQLAAFEYTYNPKTHQYYYNGPAYMHDDHVAALAAALDGVRQGIVSSGVKHQGFL